MVLKSLRLSKALRILRGISLFRQGNALMALRVLRAVEMARGDETRRARRRAEEGERCSQTGERTEKAGLIHAKMLKVLKSLRLSKALRILRGISLFWQTNALRLLMAWEEKWIARRCAPLLTNIMQMLSRSFTYAPVPQLLRQRAGE